ncbi:hypothetical protein O59_003860 [Cellvibrio sp. BR]|nr:hypothetical protein O59_003860 [Cellvibrio sp. BR]
MLAITHTPVFSCICVMGQFLQIIFHFFYAGLIPPKKQGVNHPR